MKNKSNDLYKKIIARNKKASYNYSLEETFEAGIVLLGSEVKSLREGSVSIQDSYASLKKNEIFLLNLYIAPYNQASIFNHDTKRVRKLLLCRKEIKKIIGKIKLKGYSLIPISIYFNHKNFVKLDIALGKGKKNYDKRQDIKQKDWSRQKAKTTKYT